MLYYFLHIAILFSLLWLYSKYYVRTDHKLYFISGACAKLLSGLAFWFLVVVVLSSESDSMTYLNASLAWKELFYEDPTDYLSHFFYSSESISGVFTRQPRAVFFVKIVSLISLITGGSYLINTLYFSLVAFSGSWFLFTRLLHTDKQKSNLWWLMLFLFPGLFIWTSGILKETIVVTSLFVLIGIYLDYRNRTKGIFFRDALLLIISVTLLIKAKYYVAAVFMPMLAFAFYGEFIKRNERFGRGAVKYLLPFVLLVSAILFVVNLSPNFEPGNLLNRIVIDHNRLLKLSVNEEFRINYSDFNPSYYSFVKNAPMALFSGLFRPFIWEGSRPLQILAGLQNSVLLLAVIFATLQQFVYKRFPPFEICILLTYSVIMATFLAFSTPNFGTLERYKILYQPFLLIALAGYFQQVIMTKKLLLRSPLKSKDE